MTRTGSIATLGTRHRWGRTPGQNASDDAGCFVASSLAWQCRVLSANPIGWATRLVPRGNRSNSAYDFIAPDGSMLRGRDPHRPL